MSSHSFLLHAVCYGAGFLGGFYLLAVPIFEKGRQAPPWIRMGLWLGGTTCVLWSVIGGLILSGVVLSPRAIVAMQQAKTFLSGMGVGILLLLFSSGEFIRVFSSRPKNASNP